MPLSNSQFDEIMRTYQERRQRHMMEADRRYEQFRTEHPQLIALQDQIRALKLELTKQTLFGALSEDHQQQQETLAKLQLDYASQFAATGYTEEDFQDQFDCPYCKDTGFLADRSHCNCFKQAAIDLLYQRSKLKDIISDDSFETASMTYYPETISASDGQTYMCRQDMEEVFSRAKQFASSFSLHPEQNMILSGPTGVGKTFLTHCIAREVVSNCNSVVYMTASGLIHYFEEQMYRSYSDDVERSEDPILDSDLLIIDDLGSETVNNFTIPKLFYTLNERLVNKKGVLISTNLSAKDLRDIYSERISSRILSEYETLFLYGSDIRMQKKLQR